MQLPRVVDFNAATGANGRSPAEVEASRRNEQASWRNTEVNSPTWQTCCKVRTVMLGVRSQEMVKVWSLPSHSSQSCEEKS